MASRQPPQDREAAARKKNGQFGAGNRANPGGVRKGIREIEAMLDDEHRTPEKMRETFALLRRVAHGVDEPVFYKGAVCGEKRVYDSGFMELYLNRVLGPVKELKVDLSDAPDEVLAYLSEKIN